MHLIKDMEHVNLKWYSVVHTPVGQGATLNLKGKVCYFIN